MKKFFIIACLFLGGMYYFTKDRDFTDVQKAIGNPAVEGKKTKKEIKAQEEKVNKYEVGECFKVSLNSDFQIYKITRVDVKRKDYYFKLCVKYKGCQTEEQQELISNFEYDHRPNSKTKCF